MTFKEKIKQNINSQRLDIYNSADAKIAYLELITDEDKNNVELIEKITQWRDTFKTCFLSEFIPTFERTKEWLDRGIIQNENRVLFKIYNAQATLVGHIGAIYNEKYVEYDYYIIGGRIGFRHASLIIARRFLNWIFEIVEVDYLLAQVRSDNIQAMRFHLKTGFRIHKETPLKKIALSEDEFRYQADSSMDNSNLKLIEIRAYREDLKGTIA